MRAEEAIAKVFAEEKIEYCSAIAFDALRVTKPHLLARLDFKPRSAVIFLVPYYSGECVNISRYAASRDYHIFLQRVGEKIGEALRSSVGARFATFGDHSPIDERTAAELAGLGTVGDSGLIINERYGTYVFIGEVLTDLELSFTSPKCGNVPPKCLHCGKCTAACPKDELGVCLSALTQKKGAFTEPEKAAIVKYGTAWGCDLCQSSCPYNESPVITPIPFFSENRIAVLDLKTVSEMSDSEFSERAYSWRGREPILRNLELIESGACEENEK